MLLVMISVLFASFVSVRVAAGRMQCANASDQAMFSMFARYDRDLFDRFDVFFIDGSCGGSGLHADKLRERYRKAAERPQTVSFIRIREWQPSWGTIY